jgi:hypothetical protein
MIDSEGPLDSRRRTFSYGLLIRNMQRKASC